jgi:hypothetical protein
MKEIKQVQLKHGMGSAMHHGKSVHGAVTIPES